MFLVGGIRFLGVGVLMVVGRVFFEGVGILMRVWNSIF